MKTSRLAAIGFTFVVVNLLSTAPAAALTSAETSCRDTIASSMERYARAASKVVTDCHKRRNAGVVAPSTDCNDVVAADDRGALASGRLDLRTDVLIECHRAESLLSHYTSCPAPAGSADDGGDTTGIDDFGEVADCLMALTDAGIGTVGAEAMGDPAAALPAGTGRCQAALGKGTAGVIRQLMRERRRCQRAADGAAAEPGYVCDGLDPTGRIAKAKAKMEKKAARACALSSGELAAMEACAATGDALVACAQDSADDIGSALIHNVYVLIGLSVTTTTIAPPTTTLEPPTTTTVEPTTTTAEPPTTTTLPGTSCGDTFPQCDGSCPTGMACTEDGDGCRCIGTGAGACAPATIRRVIHAKYDTPPTQTSLSTGWSGSAHDVDVPDGTGDVVDVTCDENCENCAISLNVQPNEPTSNCRCTGSPQTPCTVINGSDPEHCTGLDPTCRCYFGAPLALSAGGTPVCVVNRIREDYSGTMNLRTGEWRDRIRLASVVHLGLDTVSPCPTCEGDPVPNDGVRGGTCNGGLASGACDTNGIHVTFGPTSLDCLPTAATNISGGGLLLELNGSTGTSTLESTLPCDTPSGRNCPCRVCSANSSIGCSSDAQCAAVGAGVCTGGGGAGVQPNQCENFDCGDDARCTIGPVDMYCDGVTHPDGRGFAPCTSDTDCASVGGACTVIDIRRCYTDPISVTGRPDVLNPLTVAAFCIPPTTNPAVNLSGGIPGPGTFALDFDADIRCQSNKELPYEFPDGANCIAGATTTTTLLPVPQCEDAESPVCGGVCPLGQACTDNAGVCECTGLPLPSCGEATAPLCGGVCPDAGDVCLDNGGVCECVIPTLPQCLGAEAPTCGGLCPTGEVCLSVAGNCECQAPGLPACGTAAAPTCAGVCDVGQVCTASGNACTCTNVLPPCSEAQAPICGGSCPIGALCVATGEICQCSLLPLP